MSFASDVKQEVSLNEWSKDESRACLSALIHLTSSLSISSKGMALVCKTENASVSRTMYRMCKELYDVEIIPSVKRRMNLKKNLIYRLRLEGNVKEILQDLGIYSSRGLLDKPLQKIVVKDGAARAYLAGAFMAEGSVNSPTTTNYHLEIKAQSESYAEFLIKLLDRFYIPAKKIERRGHYIVYSKNADKIADFLRVIGSTECLLEFEDVRISRDLSSNIQRLNNVDVANEMKSMKAAQKQIEDIEYLQEVNQFQYLDDKLKEIAILRMENPESSLNELADLYRSMSGENLSKSGIKHRFVKIHEFKEKVEKRK